MARARNIKPGLYRNEHLLKVSIWGRYLFPGLWTLADRRGRLEDRPMKIKLEIFPGDDVDVDELLGELEEQGFLIRYAVDGMRYIQIENFEKHQRPHQNEAESDIPAPVCEVVPSIDTSTCDHGDKHGVPRSKALRSDPLLSDPLLEPNGSCDPREKTTPRKRNPVWDTVCEVCGINPDGPYTNTSETNIGKTVSELVRARASPEEIRRRAGVYQRKYPDAALTVNALRKHWAEIERDDPKNRPKTVEEQYKRL